jgi:hypothetical protein
MCGWLPHRPQDAPDNKPPHASADRLSTGRADARCDAAGVPRPAHRSHDQGAGQHERRRRRDHGVRLSRVAPNFVGPATATVKYRRASPIPRHPGADHPREMGLAVHGSLDNEGSAQRFAIRAPKGHQPTAAQLAALGPALDLSSEVRADATQLNRPSPHRSRHASHGRPNM